MGDVSKTIQENYSRNENSETYRDGEIIASRELSDLTGVPERRAHDNGLVAELLVVVEDRLD